MERFVIKGDEAGVSRLNDTLMMAGSVVEQKFENGKHVYKPNEDGTFVVRALTDGIASIIKSLLKREGFEMLGKVKDSDNSGHADSSTEMTEV